MSWDALVRLGLFEAGLLARYCLVVGTAMASAAEFVGKLGKQFVRGLEIAALRA